MQEGITGVRKGKPVVKGSADCGSLDRSNFGKKMGGGSSLKGGSPVGMGGMGGKSAMKGAKGKSNLNSFFAAVASKKGGAKKGNSVRAEEKSNGGKSDSSPSIIGIHYMGNQRSKMVS